MNTLAGNWFFFSNARLVAKKGIIIVIENKWFWNTSSD